VEIEESRKEETFKTKKRLEEEIWVVFGGIMKNYFRPKEGDARFARRPLFGWRLTMTIKLERSGVFCAFNVIRDSENFWIPPSFVGKPPSILNTTLKKLNNTLQIGTI